MDTGCDITTISEEAAAKSQAEIITHEKYRPQLADGYTLELNKARVLLKIAGKCTYLEVVILPSLPIDCLIGLDVFSTHPITKALHQEVKQ